MKIFALVLVLVSGSLIASCSSSEKHKSSGDDSVSVKSEPGIVGDEVSLKSDRSQFDDLRKDMPEEIKKSNDELALVFSMMGEGTDDPQKVRDRFNKALRDRREKNDKILNKRREEFTKLERKGREDYTEKSKKQREDFMSRNRKPEDRKRFFDDQDASRRDFYADQADKRKDFESDINEQRKTFEDYSREKTNQFNQEHREYSTRYYERQKALALKKQSEQKAQDIERRKAADADRAAGGASSAGPTNGGPDPLEDFKKIPKGPGSPLAPSDDGN